MLVSKIIKIANIGKIKTFNFQTPNWNGIFKKNTIIYAPNGSGKTTISMVFQSLKDDPDLLKKKIPFFKEGDAPPDQRIELIADGKMLYYGESKWNRHLDFIETFNIHFIEDNLFSGSRQLAASGRNLFMVIGGADGDRKRVEIRELQKKIKNWIHERRKIKGRQGIAAEAMKAAIEDLDLQIKTESEKLHERNQELGLFAQTRFTDFVERTNANLEKFSRSMRLEKISAETNQKTTFYVQFGDNRVTFDERNGAHEFKYTLSEGDKNALAFSVFLAKLSFIENPQDWLIVFDDPLSSLDSNRRVLTINELVNLSSRFRQMIVLTHDALFAADLERSLFDETLSLELKSSPVNRFTYRDHASQIRTGYFKDLDTILHFLENGAENDARRREVMRCLRPLLEGFVRVKYYDVIGPNQWLGNFIEMIRSAVGGSPLYHLKGSPAFNDLCLINDYSKAFHHANPSEQSIDINEDELYVMAQKTLALLKKV